MVVHKIIDGASFGCVYAGEVVKIKHPKTPGLWKIMEIKISFLVAKNIETQKTVRAKSTLLERIDKEDSELISDLDEIGL